MRNPYDDVITNIPSVRAEVDRQRRRWEQNAKRKRAAVRGMFWSLAALVALGVFLVWAI